MATGFIGEIRTVGFSFAPINHAFCNGQLMAISSNFALFALIGTTYGGDGVNTFQLPNMQGRNPISQGQAPGLSNYLIGEIGGSENITLTVGTMPAHTHAVTATAGPDIASSGSPTANTWNAQIATPNPPYDVVQNVTMAPNAIGQTGGSQPHNNLQPLLAINFIIALFGIFPSRN